MKNMLSTVILPGTDNSGRPSGAIWFIYLKLIAQSILDTGEQGREQATS